MPANRRDEPHSIDIFTNTIMTLRKKVFQLEQELVQIQHFAYHDELMGLPNRSLLKDEIKAEFRDGLLRIHLEKTEKAKPKSIEVEIAA